MLKVTVVAPNGAEVTEDFKTENTVAFVYLQATDKLIAQGHIRRDDNVFFVNPKSDRALAAGLNVSDIADGEDAIKLRLRNERIPTGG